jgi:farnesyl-diphosphate farnesyltransferase
MGLFLQKVNITRDYFEDIVTEPPRMFWPKDIWGNFAANLADLKKPGFESRALECCNAMVANALRHIPDCLDYMATLHEPSVFLFCAIPQVMAIATLSELYNNYNIFHNKVKISKGATCKIIINSVDMRSLLQQFETYCTAISEKLVETDPSYDECKQLMQRAFDAIKAHSIKCGCDESPSYARRFLVQYPALGGRLLFNAVDGVRALLKPAQV